MKIPLTYNLRNLVVRKTTTVMTALGVALTVAVLLSVLALLDGLRIAFQSTGNPLHVLILRKGSESELVSNFTREMYQVVRAKPGIQRGKSGEPRASLEMVTVVNLPRVDSPEGMNVTIRGLMPVGIEMREDLKLLRGRWFESGRREVVVGSSIAKRFPGAEVGKKIHAGSGDWDVVGVMEAGTGVSNSEIFADLNQLSSDYNRTEVVSSALVEASDEVAAQALINDLNSDRRLNVEARTEKDYYAAQTVSGAPIQYIGTLVAIIMAVGSSVAAMNTMYAAVARRAREIGTLRVLGFSRGSILFSFLIESVLLALLGGLIGVLLTLPLNGVTTGIGNFVTFSEIAFNFHVGPKTITTGLIFAMLMGAVGGLFPALMAAKKEILIALREI
ncbi:MAG TPA: ABC transporter permease [Bryobacteraceae bacterium]|nr:ABC transporter permease [Bryobacteraceae bacterium]